jgi:hypothetical protein
MNLAFIFYFIKLKGYLIKKKIIYTCIGGASFFFRFFFSLVFDALIKNKYSEKKNIQIIVLSML